MHSFDIEDDDLIILGTDGLFDNMYPKDIYAVVSSTTLPKDVSFNGVNGHLQWPWAMLIFYTVLQDYSQGFPLINSERSIIQATINLTKDGSYALKHSLLVRAECCTFGMIPIFKKNTFYTTKLTNFKYTSLDIYFNH